MCINVTQIKIAEPTMLTFWLQPGCSEQMHCLPASDDKSIWGSANSMKTGYSTKMSQHGWNRTRQCVCGTVCFVREVFKTQHNENQGSGCPNAGWETQDCKINLPRDARLYPRSFSTFVFTTPQPPSQIPALGQAATDLRTTFECTPTLKAEVLWCLNTVTKCQSYKSD